MTSEAALATETPQTGSDDSSQADKTILPERSQTLGDTLIRMGCITPDDVPKILAYSARTGKKFGVAALALGMVAKKDINAALSIQQGLFHDDRHRVKVPASLITLHSPHTEEAEQFRRVRTRLVTKSEGTALRLLCVSGVGAETACSFVAANLAVAVSQLGRKVLLVDSNLRLSHMNQLLGLRPRMGLTDVVRGTCNVKDAYAPGLIRNLTYLPAGRPSFNPQELLCSEKYATTIMEQMDHYDSVIVNTGDSLDTADAQLVWALTKSVLLVARRDRTRTPDIRKITSLMTECRAQLVGTVMTR